MSEFGDPRFWFWLGFCSGIFPGACFGVLLLAVMLGRGKAENDAG